MILQGSLFGDPAPIPPKAPARPTKAYPAKPGWKAAGTSKEAAEGIEPRSHTLCDLTLASLKRGPKTPEQVAAELGEPVHSIRPRFSQLSARGLIEKTEGRLKAMGGRQATIWKACDV